MVRNEPNLHRFGNRFGQLALFFLASQAVRELNQAVTREASLNTGEQLQALQLIPEVKISGLEANLLKKLVGRKIKWLNESSRLTIKRTIIESLPTFLNSGSYAIILFFGGHKVLDGEMTFGVLVAFQGLMMQFLNPIQQMLSQFADIQEAQGNIDRIDDVFSQTEGADEEDNVDDSDNEGEPNGKEDRTITFPLLELKDITFGYQKLKPPLLENFDLTIGPGKWAAFVGASGSGKSTVTRLLSQLYQPWSEA